MALRSSTHAMQPEFLNHRSARVIRLLAFTLLALMLAMATGCRKDRDRMDDRGASELYADAKQYLDNKSWDRAIQTYKYLQTRYPFGRYTEQSMLDLSYAYFKAREPQGALSTLNRFIRTYPTHPNVDYAYYLKGLVNYEENLGFLERLMPERVRDRDQSAARDAFMDFNELLRRFPDSRYVADARQRMVYLRNNLAAYEVDVADYYMRRQAYVAAANRARYALENYPNTPESAEALVVLHQAYTELDLPELAAGAMSVLELNYPDNYYVQGRKKKKSWAERLWPFD
ncbi:outer membrane protein assembly factor BamD [Elongatibacter sediminis]|uniref:Outer membrane protein assembly factor BamD n=1 Tax=Elongatibacter sediminis TaxID=3119006 RepID=A0AAW9R9C2_9GAMM